MVVGEFVAGRGQLEEWQIASGGARSRVGPVERWPRNLVLPASGPGQSGPDLKATPIIGAAWSDAEPASLQGRLAADLGAQAHAAHDSDGGGELMPNQPPARSPASGALAWQRGRPR